MLRVGLTGGTGAGKSTVASRLADHGALVVDADALAREVLAPGTEGLAAVVEEFGAGVLAGDGALDRPAMAALVFADPARRRVLEEITHPRIAALTEEILDRASDDRVVVHDVPLLVEKRMGAAYHLVVVVDAAAEVRVRRLVGSRGMEEDDARARVRSQARDVERRQAADVLLDNSGAPELVLGAVDDLWFGRLVPFERNVRQHEAAPRGAVVQLTTYDPMWPEQARRLMGRVQLVTGDRGLAVEHIGSTAVPGLTANDVLDLQLVVESPSVVDDLRSALEQAGFVEVPGEWRHDEPGDHDAQREFWSCDPGRAVNLHVLTPGRTAVRTVLFRDWLRAHDAERNAFAEVKKALQGQRIDAYTQGKGPWIRAAYERAEEWARRTGWALDR